jgi:hypothetical protein
MECEPLQRLKALDLTTFRLRAAYGATGRITQTKLLSSAYNCDTPWAVADLDSVQFFAGL